MSNATQIISLASSLLGSPLPTGTTHRVATQSDAEAITDIDISAAASDVQAAAFATQSRKDPFLIRVTIGGVPASASFEIFSYLDFAANGAFQVMRQYLITLIAAIIGEVLPSASLSVSVRLILTPYNASGNTFPVLGSAPDGTVRAGDFFKIGVAGAPAGIALDPGASILAKIDNPGQVVANWTILY